MLNEKHAPEPTALLFPLAALGNMWDLFAFLKITLTYLYILKDEKGRDITMIFSYFFPLHVGS